MPSDTLPHKKDKTDDLGPKSGFRHVLKSQLDNALRKKSWLDETIEDYKGPLISNSLMLVAWLLYLIDYAVLWSSGHLPGDYQKWVSLTFTILQLVILGWNTYNSLILRQYPGYREYFLIMVDIGMVCISFGFLMTNKNGDMPRSGLNKTEFGGYTFGTCVAPLCCLITAWIFSWI